MPVCAFFAALFTIPVIVAIHYLVFVLMPSDHSGSGPNVGSDLRGVAPVFMIIILGLVGIILSIVGMYLRELGAGFVLLFYELFPTFLAISLK
jgi:hypothetical protein